MAQRKVNRARGAKIGTALERAGYEGSPDWRSSVADALTDLRHLCDTHGLDFGDCDRSAYEHYLTELHASDAEAKDAESHFERTGKL